MRLVPALALLGSALLLAACDPPPQSKPLDESTAEQPADAQGQPAPEGADKYSPMAKAKHVEVDVMDAKQQQDKEIDKGAN